MLYKCGVNKFDSSDDTSVKGSTAVIDPDGDIVFVLLNVDDGFLGNVCVVDDDDN